jgi:hypothetical protein
MISKERIVDVTPKSIALGNDVIVCVASSKLASKLGIDHAKYFLMFFGDGSWWNIKFLREEDGKHVGVIDNFYGEKLNLKFLVGDASGNYRFSDVYSFKVEGGEYANLADEQQKPMEAFGVGAGVNWIPNMGPNALEINLRTLRELKDLGVKDVQVNLYLNFYAQLEMFEDILRFCDESGMNIYFLFREVEPLGEIEPSGFLDDLGLIAKNEVIRYSTVIVTKGQGIIRQGSFSEAISLDDYWLPHRDTTDIIKVEAYAYDPREEDPFKTMADITQKVSWKILSHITMETMLNWIFEGDRKRINLAEKMVKTLFKSRSVKFTTLAEKLRISESELSALITPMGRLIVRKDEFVNLGVPREFVTEGWKTHPARGLLMFKAKDLDKYEGWAFTVLFWVKTARLWTLGPVWNDEYYERVYKRVLVGKVKDAVKLGLHPSVKAVSFINEPTLSWNGGEIVDENIMKLWHAFLEQRFEGDIDELNRAFQTGYRGFDEVEYVPRVVYRGAYHTAWSGKPGAPMNCMYEYVKTLFKYWLMSLCYDRMARAMKEAFNKPVFIKYNHVEPDFLAERANDGYQASRLPSIDILGIDVYPLGYPYTPIKDPLEKLSLFIYEAANIVLLGAANNKPAWITEYACGKSRSYREETARLTELVNLAFFGMGIPQAHYWAVVPWGKQKTSEYPYCPQAGKYEDRVLPTIRILGKLTKEHDQRKVKSPSLEIFLAYPDKDAFLSHATKDKFTTKILQAIGTELIERGYTVVHGVLTKEACEKSKMVVIYEGYYLSDEDKELLTRLEKPLAVLGHCFPTNPLLGTCRKVSEGSDPFSFATEEILTLEGMQFNIAKTIAVNSPPGATVYDTKVYEGREYQPVFSVGRTLIFGHLLKDVRQYANVIEWWYQKCNAQDDPPNILKVDVKPRGKKCECTIIAADDTGIENVEVLFKTVDKIEKVKARKIGPLTYHAETNYERGAKCIVKAVDTKGQSAVKTAELN